MNIAVDVARVAAARSALALILVGGQAMAQTSEPGLPRPVSTARAARADQATPPGAAAPQPTLEGSYWKAIELAGMTVPAGSADHEAHLVFQASRVSGSDGCNRVTGTYELKGEALTFGPIAGTLMACADSAEVERGFQAALKRTSHWRIAGNRLELYGATGKPLAVFERRNQPPPGVTAFPLEGTRWQLVGFRSSDGSALTPDDKTKYTIEFAAGGQLTVRIDCNRGRSTWKSTSSNQLGLGPLALTRASCPEGSLHDQIVKQWSFIRSYLIKDSHLYLVLMAHGGAYEFEPMADAPASRR